jgi:drug/metabolite transporter (DMT)-like permease
MVFAALAFAIMVSCVKVARAEMSALEVVMWRGLVSIPVAALIARRYKWRIHHRRWFGLRIAFGFGAMLSFFTAAKGLMVTDMAIIGRLQPAIIALVAPLILGNAERPAPQVWWVLVAGLIGCTILIGPEMAMGNTYGVWAVIGIVLSSGAHVTLRALRTTDEAPVIVLMFQIAVTVLAIICIVVFLGKTPALPPKHLWLPIAGVGALASIGQVLMTRAYAVAKAARVAAASHISPLWGVVVDVAVFAFWPTPRMWLGGAIVLAAVFWLMRSPSEDQASG